MIVTSIYENIDIGNFRGQSLTDIYKIDSESIEKFAIHDPEFYISHQIINDMADQFPGFRLSDEARRCLWKKYEDWAMMEIEEEKNWIRNEELRIMEEEGTLNYQRPESYEDWLRSEFGDDAGTAYWNLD